MKCVWCQDIERHQAEAERRMGEGLSADHPLVARWVRRQRGAGAFAARAHDQGEACDNSQGTGHEYADFVRCITNAGESSR